MNNSVQRICNETTDQNKQIQCVGEEKRGERAREIDKGGDKER